MPFPTALVPFAVVYVYGLTSRNDSVSQVELFLDWRSFFLDTDRLHIRVVQPADANDLQALMTAGISHWIAAWPYPISISAVERILTDARARAADGRSLPMVIVEKSTGQTIGWIKIDIETTDQLRTAELGYWLSEGAQGRGFAYEAAKAVITACFDQLQIDIVEAGAQTANEVSHNLLAKLGMRKVEERLVYAPARRRHEKCLFWRIDRLPAAYGVPA